jgi:hypothetical protein
MLTAKYVWRGCRYELRPSAESSKELFVWDFEFYDRIENAAVAYIRKCGDSNYEVHLTIPNMDAYLMESIPQICSEIPKLIRSYLTSKRFK